MLNKWVGAALLGLGVGLGTQARGQYLPRPVGAARMPEPAPVNPQCPPAAIPSLIPGPLTPELAPPAPGPDLTLSEEHSSAFQAVEPESKLDLVFSAGSIFLQRQGIGHNPVAVLDNQARPLQGVINVPILSNVSVGANSAAIIPQATMQTFPVNHDVFFQMLGYPDDGRNPPAGSPFFGEFSDLRARMAAGVKFGFMLVGESTALEISGFAVSNATASTTIVSPSINLNPTVSLANRFDPVVPNPLPPPTFPLPSPPGAAGGVGTQIDIIGDPITEVKRRLGPQYSELDLPFFNAPAGFEGNNGLWRNADLVQLRFQSSLSSLEGNVRCWTNVGGPCEGIIGLRFFDHTESLDYTTVDDTFPDVINPNPILPASVPVFGPSNTPLRRVGDPTVTATYRTHVENRVIGPQLGLEGHLLPFNWLALSYSGKAMAGVNLLDRQVSLTRGDGLTGFRTEEHLQRFAHAYEMAFNADVSLLECAHLRLGYNFFWLVDIASAVGQIDYDLSHTAGRRNSSDSVLYHGPSIELQFVF